MKAVRWSVAMPLLVALSACTTSGIGVGTVAGGTVTGLPVGFHWTSTNGGLSGELTATLGDTTYLGQFFQVTQQARSEFWLPPWPIGYSDRPPWPGWYGTYPHQYPGFYPNPGRHAYRPTLTTFYTGTVLATLRAPNNQSMHCTFQLAEPVSGLAAGGEGDCGLSSGATLRAVLGARQR